MKYLILILIIGFNFVHFKLAAQCKTGDVHISTETKLNEFKSNFSACDTIFGNLIIGPEILGGKTRLIEINGLENIKVILGNLEITSNQWLEDISGLQNITYIKGDFIYRQNPKLMKNLTFITTQIDGSVDLSFGHFSNAQITFPYLTHVAGDLRFSTSNEHRSIFPTLKTIGNSLSYYSNSKECYDLNQLENVKTVNLGFTGYNTIVHVLQKLRTTESFGLEVKLLKKITLSPALLVDYFTLNGDINHSLPTFSKNKNYKSFKVFNLTNAKYFKENFGSIDSINFLYLDADIVKDSLYFPNIKYVKTVTLHGSTIKILPNIKSISNQLHILGDIESDWVYKYVNRDDFISEVSINSLKSKRLSGAPKINCDVFKIEHNPNLIDLKEFEFKNINAKIIEITSNRIDSINFNTNDIDITKTQLYFYNNTNLKYCPPKWYCELFKNQHLFSNRKYKYIFSGNKSTCNDNYLSTECNE